VGGLGTCTWEGCRENESQGFFWGLCTPSVIGENFAVVLSWAAIRIGCPKLQVSLSEVHDKMTEINGFTVPQLFFEHVLLYQTNHGSENMGRPAVIRPGAQSLFVSMYNLFGSSAVALGQIIVKTHCGTKPVEL
jgi:hypothetical protein